MLPGLATPSLASPRPALAASAAHRKIRSCARRADSEPPAAPAARLEPSRAVVRPLGSAFVRALGSASIRALVEHSASFLPARSVRRAGTEWPRQSAPPPWAPPPPTLRPPCFRRHRDSLSPELAHPPAAAAIRRGPRRGPVRKSLALRSRL